ncbi:MAG: hypothetical protein EOL87_06045 [Spartobacteria bacterium]|nr:hypothetical protein [Spartobacteria bacterium]
MDADKNGEEIFSGFNMLPDWARTPPGVQSNEHIQPNERPAPQRKRADRNQRRQPNRPILERPRRPRPELSERTARPAPERRRREFRDLPFDVFFVPEKISLGYIVRQVRSTMRAYPLMNLASLFLQKSENYTVKLELKRDCPPEDAVPLVQCPHCKLPFCDRDTLNQHMIAEHMPDMFESKVVDTEAPSGNFQCVGRCPITHKWIGPPNWHGFEENIRAIHALSKTLVPVADYRSMIEMCHAPEDIDAWKKENSTKTVYFLKNEEEPTELSAAEATELFLKAKKNRGIKEMPRVMIPGSKLDQIIDEDMKYLVRRALNRESKTAFTLAIALRPAFKHMGLLIFKGPEGYSFVTGIKPVALDAEKTVDTVRTILDFIADHPNCTRQFMAQAVVPDATPDSDEVKALLKPLQWLIERGHVIEFYNGTLLLPVSKKS